MSGYPSDISDESWSEINKIFAPEYKVGRHRTIDRREILNGIFYVLKTGIPWEYMPHDLPNWKICYNHFRRWDKDGSLEAAQDILRRLVRLRQGRNMAPSAAIIDSRSVVIAEKKVAAVGLMPVKK